MKKAKKQGSSRKISGPGGSSENFSVLLEAGVVIDHERLTEAEKEVIASLSEEEVDALRSVYKKFSKIEKGKNPIWRAFCF